MKHMMLFIAIGLLLVIVSTALAQTGSGAAIPSSAGYDLTWNTSDGGGDVSAGNGYTLMGTIGQSDAGLLMTGGGYSLAGGFWGEGANQYNVYLPMVLK